ncbi:unnamed protein product [Closterium sp. NIES-53]
MCQCSGSGDVTFDESVPFYRLFPYRSAPSLPPPLFLAPGPPPVDPLPPHGHAPSRVSQVDPLPGTVPVQVAVVSCAAPGAASGGVASGGAEPGGEGSGGEGSEGAPSPYTEQTGGLTERREPASRPVLPVCTARRIPRSHPPPIPDTNTMTLRPSSVSLHVTLPPPPESSLPEVPDP